MTRSRVLVIGGTDTSGGAGVQADLRALDVVGAEAAVVVTAVTAQTMTEVRAVTPMAVELIREQAAAALDEPIGAVKVGLLPSIEIVAAVADIVAGLHVPVVVDPVRQASTGDTLAEGTGAALQGLLPHATVVTPNVAELVALAGADVEDLDDLRAAAVALAQQGPSWVLATGGHLDAREAVDVLTDGDQMIELSGPRVDADVRGTGCTLASLLAGSLCHSDDVVTAAHAAKQHLNRMFGSLVATPSGRARFGPD